MTYDEMLALFQQNGGQLQTLTSFRPTLEQR